MRIFDRIDQKKCLVLLGLALVAVLCSLALSENDEVESACVSCHQDVYEEGLSNFCQHPPFADKQCEKCHLEGSIVSVDSSALSREILGPVVLSYPEYLAEHTILLRGLVYRATYDITIALQDMSGNKVRKEFKGVVPENVQDIRKDDKKPPKISGVEVGPVVKGVFLETTITWETDEPSTSCVEYGFSDRYGLRTPEDNALVRQHSVNIYELEGGRGYHFRVVSRDIFGNEAVSEDLAFNTAKAQPLPSDIEKKGADQADNRGLGLAVNRVETFLLNSDLGLYLETTEPSSVTVEYLKVEEPSPEEEPQVRAVTSSEDDHPELRDGKALTIDACYQHECHPPEDLGVSHPVGIGASEKTKVPDDLPTLEGGVLTCVTCHFPHGGSKRYFARKEITRDICISCHEGY